MKKLKQIRVNGNGPWSSTLAGWLANMTSKVLAAECKARGIPVAKYKGEMSSRLADDIIERGQKIELRIG